MNTALIISLGAVAVSLFAVFISQRKPTTKTRARGDNGGSGYVASDTGSGADCSPGDSGGCDGGGGGGD
jgi:hypothetical protein